jgi:RNA polymerase sigma factor (sigma-70 family)
MVQGRLGPALNDFHRLWNAGTISGLSDARLLEQFIADRDELAFDALMTRHGPLVWSVCRSILSDPHDVEDAFQASFLILVRKAHSLRVGDSLCGWLYRVSYRVAQEARVQRDRRRVRERAAVGQVAAAGETERARDELLGVLSQEINRLPEKYRLPIVLCRLEGLTREQAASQLGWPPGTVATRLGRGLDRLRQRMRRRLGDDAGGLSGWLGGLVSTSLPGTCREATTQAALTLAQKGWGAAGLTSSAFTLARSVHRALFWTSVRSIVLIACGLAVVPWVALGWLRSGTGQAPPPVEGSGRVVLRQDPVDRPEPQKPNPVASDEAADRLTYAGQVLDPNGRPLSGATVYLELPDANVVLHKLGTSGADGRFRTTVSRRELTKPGTEPRWRLAKVVATAPGYGPVWEWTPVPVRLDTRPTDDLMLRLTRDDVPIDGRILTVEGRPVVGARIVASTLTYGRNTAGEPIPWDSPANVAGWSDLRLGSLAAEATTDATGRFRIKGIGSDRLVTLGVTGPHVAQQEIQVQTRTIATRRVEVPGELVNGRPPTRPIYGASFIHIAEPGRLLEGIVREQGTGQPIAGAQVNAIATDGEGRFRIDGLDREFEYALQVHGPPGRPYFNRRLTIASQGHGLDPVTAEVELSRGVLIRGRLTDRMTGKPIRGGVFYAPLKGNPHAPEVLGRVENDDVSDEAGQFAVIGLPGRGVLRVTAGTADVPVYPTLHGVWPEDRRRGLALLDDEFVLDALPRPVSLVGSHAYQVIDIPEGRRDFEQDFDLAVHPGRTVTVRVVDPSGTSLQGVDAFGLKDPSLTSRASMHGDGSFAVHDLDSDLPRRVLFHQPVRDLAGFLDLTGNEAGDLTARLSPCGSIVGRVVDRAGQPIAGAHFGLVYDDGQDNPHITFPAGIWVPTALETKRDQRTGADVVPSSPINLHMTSGEDGRFQIHHVLPGAKFHLKVIIDQVFRRLGLGARINVGSKVLLERAIAAGQVLDLGDVRILPEELRGKR